MQMKVISKNNSVSEEKKTRNDKAAIAHREWKEKLKNASVCKIEKKICKQA